MPPIPAQLRRFGALLLFLLAGTAAAQTGLPSQTWPAGTHLSTWNAGGRITTFHRGRLYLGGVEGQGTWIYDIANPLAPQQLQFDANAVNGHTWQKVGDLFYRQYWNPEGGYNADVPEGVSQFVSLADPLARTRWTAPIHNFPVQTRVWGGGFMDTYPYWFYSDVVDARIGWWPLVSGTDVDAMSGVNARNKFRLGNLLFFTPGDGQQGVAVFDISNPATPVLLDTLTTGIRQYTTAWQVYKHYLVLMIGEDTNGPNGNANTLIIDFSDPSDLRIDQTLSYAQLPGRYVHFKDRYAFAGRGEYGVKFDMETRTPVREFRHPSPSVWFGDFQWIPLGHLLLVSTSETNMSQSHLFAHQDGLDTTPPTVAYHLPRPNAVNQSLTTSVGLVIHERLDATTVNDQTIQLRPLGGAALPGVVMHTSYDVVHFHPAQPLLANTTYELSLVGGGVRDVAGNAVAPFSFRFATGATLQGGGPPQVTGLSHAPASPVQTGASVNFILAASVAGGTLDYRFDFGDGTPQTAWVTGQSSLAHAFATPGVYTVQGQARSQTGEIAGATATLVVQRAGAGVARRSTALLRHPVRNEVWVTNPDHGSVAAIDAATLARLGEVATGAHPASLAVAANGHLWVANRDADTLQRIDPATRTVVQSVPLDYGDRPVALLTSPDGATGYVALAGPGQVRRFDAASGTLGPALDVGPTPAALALAADGSALYVARLVSAGNTGEVRRIALPAFAAASVVTLPQDTGTADSGTAARGLPNYLGSLALSGDGAQLWYGGKKDNIARGRFREATDLSFETSMRALIGRIDTAAGSETVAQRRDLDNLGRVSALLLAPGDAVLFAAFENNRRVVALDPWDRSVLAEAEVGFAPQALALDPASGRLFVQNFLSRQVQALDAAALLAQGSGTLASLGSVASSASEPLSAQVLAGKRTFYDAADPRMGQDGYFSCAMCHLDGRDDGRTWDFTQLGEGLRNTTSLRGAAGLGHGLVHWSANFDEIQDFEIPIRNLFGGLGFMDDVDFAARAAALGLPKAGRSAPLDALAAYVGSLASVDRSPHRAADGSLTADGVAGRALFLQLGCQRCHAGAAFTDSPQGYRHDLGTLVPSSGTRLGGPLLALDTPSLRGVAGTPPYLHDGRAATLEAVFEQHNATGRHGDTASLAPMQFAQLMAFLRQIDGSEPGMPAAPQLALSAPLGGTLYGSGEPVTLAVTTDLPQITRVDYRVAGTVVASALAPPWSASWNAAGLAPGTPVQAEVHHDAGRFRTLSAAVTIGPLGPNGRLFRNGFEP
jgi:DNA-binding beta-propeller fold protein YncE